MKKEVEQRIGARRRKTEGSQANVKIGEKQVGHKGRKSRSRCWFN